MSAETLAAPQRRLRPIQAIGESSFGKTWFYRYILFPIGQMLVFIIGAAAILTVLAYLVAFIVPEQTEGFVAEQISRQLAGMIINGISIGFVYAMIALGYTLVYGVLKFINFAHSEFFMVGSVVGYELTQRLSEAGNLQNIHPALLIVITVLAAMLISGLLAAAVERLAYRPLRNAPRLVPLITAIGISFILQDGVRAFEAVSRNDFNLTYPVDNIAWVGAGTKLSFGGAVSGGFNIGGTTYNGFTINGQDTPLFALGEDEDSLIIESVSVGGLTIGGEPVRARDVRFVQFVNEADAASVEGEVSTVAIPPEGQVAVISDSRPDSVLVAGQDLEAIGDAGNVVNVPHTSIIIIGGAVLMLLALNYFVNGTKIGRGIRAISQDQPTAGLMGINVNWLITITFFVGGALGGAAGTLYGMNVGTITPYVGFIPGLKAFTAAVLGGIGNVTGALLGGLTIGMIETFLNGTLTYIPGVGIEYTDVFVFLVLILILIFRPAGILGERVDEKV